MHDSEDAGTLVITVRGVAGPSVQQAFADLEVTVVGGSTLFRVQDADQSALHGLLQRIQNLGLEVVDVHLEPTVPH